MSTTRWATWWRALQSSETTSTAVGCRKALGHLLLILYLHPLVLAYYFFRIVPGLRKPKGRHGLWVKAPTLRRWELWFLSATDFAGRLALLSLAILLYALALYLFGKPPPWHEQLVNISGGCALVLAGVWWSWALYAAGERLGWTLASWDGVEGRQPPHGVLVLQLWRARMGAATCALLAAFILFAGLALSGVGFVPQPGSEVQSWLLCALAGSSIDWLLLLIVTRHLE